MNRVTRIKKVKAPSGRTIRRKSKKGLIIVFLIVVMVVGVTGMKMIGLQFRNEELITAEQQLEAQIEEAKQKEIDLKNREKYMQTKKFIEDEAKNKLGLVYPDEIVIRPGD